MSFTNKTGNLELPQWVGTDKPTFTVDLNNAFKKIDSAIFERDEKLNKVILDLATYITSNLENNISLDDINSGNYTLASNTNYKDQNRPTGNDAYLFNYKSANMNYQLYCDSASNMYYRVKKLNGPWSIWTKIANSNDISEALKPVKDDITKLNTTLDKLFYSVDITGAEADGTDSNIVIPAHTQKQIVLKRIKTKDATIGALIKEKYHAISIHTAVAGLGDGLTIHAFGINVDEEYNKGNYGYVTCRNDTDKEISTNVDNVWIRALFVKDDMNIYGGTVPAQ